MSAPYTVTTVVTVENDAGVMTTATLEQTLMTKIDLMRYQHALVDGIFDSVLALGDEDAAEESTPVASKKK